MSALQNTTPYLYPVAGNAAQTVDEALEAKLTRYLYLKEQAAEFEKLKKELKPLFDGQEEISIGRYRVTGKSVHSPEKTVRAFTYWRWDIQPAV